MKNFRENIIGKKDKEWGIPMEMVSSFSNKSLWWFKSHYRRQFDK